MDACLKVKLGNVDVDCYNDMEHVVDDIFKNRLDTPNIAVAINPEKILSARESKETYTAIQSADLRYLDGIGAVKLAERKLGRKLSRIPGCELWESLMVESGKRKIPVYILGATNDVLGKTAEKLKSEYGVNLVGYRDGYFDNSDDIIDEIISLKPKILTVALGSPRQEHFMKRCKEKGLSCFMMGVGGTYDVFVGKVNRAPKIYRDLNLEWFYRLACQPSRVFRQVRLLKFVAYCILKRI